MADLTRRLFLAAGATRWRRRFGRYAGYLGGYRG